MTQSLDRDMIDRSHKGTAGFLVKTQDQQVQQRVHPVAVGRALSGLPEAATDDLVYLIGRPPITEFMGFVQAQTVGGSKADLGALAEEWRRANDHIRELERTEAGWADNPAVGAIQSDLQPLWQRILGTPLFRKAYAVLPTGVGLVELDRLVVYQKHINLQFVRRVQDLLGPHPSIEAVFNACFPFGEPNPPFQTRRVAPGNAFVFVSPSNDLRFLDCTLLESAQIDGYEAMGPVAGVIGLVVGFSPNCFSALRAEGRLILQNGSHRAFALRERGIAHAPCLIQQVSRRDELLAVAHAEVSTNPDLFLRAPRPPVLKDYFDPKLRKVVAVPKRNRQVKISFAVETIDV
jgi:hypothetical protein